MKGAQFVLRDRKCDSISLIVIGDEACKLYNQYKSPFKYFNMIYLLIPCSLLVK